MANGRDLARSPGPICNRDLLYPVCYVKCIITSYCCSPLPFWSSFRASLPAFYSKGLTGSTLLGLWSSYLTQSHEDAFVTVYLLTFALILYPTLALLGPAINSVADTLGLLLVIL